jgi:hypothetical protein
MLCNLKGIRQPVKCGLWWILAVSTGPLFVFSSSAVWWLETKASECLTEHGVVFY